MEEIKPAIPKALAAFFTERSAAYAVLPTKALVFDASFRDICRENSCGRYGKCWTCPPDVGDMESLRARLLAFDTVAVFSIVYPIEDAFDLPGMLAAGKKHNEFSLAVQRRAREILPASLTTAAGACTLCARCARMDGLPCRRPDEAMISLEAYGIDVLKLANAAKLPYRTGSESCAYFSAVLYHLKDVRSDTV